MKNMSMGDYVNFLVLSLTVVAGHVNEGLSTIVEEPLEDFMGKEGSRGKLRRPINGKKKKKKKKKASISL